ncbi:MAG: 16S rRNA (guanine(966)-N(2))-methyltransferase RsmD [Polyangiaceae bacterium]|nr:16S rRNA (guanine(966)-N(2))-methyltransferase RsmD [Polyangiaceae bacterium]
MRVVGGRLGGRVLRAPKGDATRPTTDRVRESLFQILGDLAGARALDLYAGTGALGIEALSRGASFAGFVEARRASAAVLRENLEALGLTGESRVVVSTVERAAPSLRGCGPFDLIFADPPWADMPAALRAVGRLVSALELADGCRLVVEHSAREPLALPSGLLLHPCDARQWGDTAVSMFSIPKPGKG